MRDRPCTETRADTPAARISLLLLVLLLAWESSSGDMRLARWFGDGAGFPLREDWLLVHVAHTAAKQVSWALVLLISLAVWWPVGWFRRIDTPLRLQLALTTLASVLAVTLLKDMNETSCPWDLAEFGGVARHASHWLGFLHGDGGPGHCFPAGHASTGFAFIGGYFVFRASSPKLAWAWLGLAVLAGLGLGMTQQVRGAHFMSHTLWTGWLCWIVAWGCDGMRRRLTAGAHRDHPLTAT